MVFQVPISIFSSFVERNTHTNFHGDVSVRGTYISTTNLAHPSHNAFRICACILLHGCYFVVMVYTLQMLAQWWLI